MKELTILITEDERSQRELLRDFLAKQGYRVCEAQNGDEAVDQVRRMAPDIALVDFKMPGKNGLEVLGDIKRLDPEVEVIMMTAYGTIQMAVDAMKAGAMDYITKPVDLDELLLLLKRASEHRTLVRENEMLRTQLREKTITQDQIIYKSAKMAALINLAGRVAESRAFVLIEGETGTGKELIARLIHSLSPRARNPLVTVNCGALPESLIESELFGHEKGAFTGAHQKRTGRFEQADGGTLFLDEIGELSPAIQVKILRFLQEGEFQRVGGNESLRSDVRLISATHRDLEAETQNGRFRQDLLYRLNVIPMAVPPLRQRREDIVVLAEHFVEKFASQNRKTIKSVSREAMGILQRYDYPGNVRELANILERAVVIARQEVISSEELPFKVECRTSSSQPAEAGTLKEAVENLEHLLVEQALKNAGGHQTRAAEALGISERMLRYKLKKYRLK